MKTAVVTHCALICAIRMVEVVYIESVFWNLASQIFLFGNYIPKLGRIVSPGYTAGHSDNDGRVCLHRTMLVCKCFHAGHLNSFPNILKEADEEKLDRRVIRDSISSFFKLFLQ